MYAEDVYDDIVDNEQKVEEGSSSITEQDVELSSSQCVDTNIVQPPQ